jgi:hypothetical protein
MEKEGGESEEKKKRHGTANGEKGGNLNKMNGRGGQKDGGC